MTELSPKPKNEGEAKLDQFKAWVLNIFIGLKRFLIDEPIVPADDSFIPKITTDEELAETEISATNKKIFFRVEGRYYQLVIGDTVDIQCFTITNLTSSDYKKIQVFLKSYNSLMDVSQDLMSNESGRKSRQSAKYKRPFDDSIFTASRHGATLGIDVKYTRDVDIDTLTVSNFWINEVVKRIDDTLKQIDFINDMFSELHIKKNNKSDASAISIPSVISYIDTGANFLKNLKKQIELLVFSRPIDTAISKPPNVEFEGDSCIIKFQNGRIYTTDNINKKIEQIKFLEKQIKLYDSFYRTFITMNGNPRISTVNRRTLECYARMFNLSIEKQKMDTEEVIKFLKFWYKAYANALSFKHVNLGRAQNIFNRFERVEKVVVDKLQIEIDNEINDEGKTPSAFEYVLFDDEIVDLVIEFILQEIQKVRDTFDVKYDLSMIIDYLKEQEDLLIPFDLSNAQINTIIKGMEANFK